MDRGHSPVNRSVKSLTDCASANRGADRPALPSVSGKSSPTDVVKRSAGTFSCGRSRSTETHTQGKVVSLDAEVADGH